MKQAKLNQFSIVGMILTLHRSKANAEELIFQLPIREISCVPDT